MISDEQVQAALKAYKSTRGPASDSMRNALEAAEIEDVERWLTTVPPQQEKLEAADWRAFRDVQLRCHELDPRVVPDLELPQGDYWPARNKDELARFKEWLASQDEPECEHVWRSSFGDTFCEKCNQDAPVEIASERCRTCKGSGTWADEGWSKPPQPCKACSGSGLAPIRKRKPTVPVQQDEPEGDEYPRKDGDVLVLGPECIAAEDGSAIIWKGEHYSRSLQDFASDGEGSSADPGSPPARQTAAGSQPSPVPVQQDEPEGLMCSSYSGRPTNERCTKDAGHGGLHEGEMLRWSDGPRPLLPGCKTCGAATGETCHKDCPQQIADTMTVPSVGLRDRVACELANLEYERSGRPCETEDFYANADRVLSVLHEAGTQEDGLDALARQFKNGQTVVWGDGPHQQGTVVGFCYTIPEQAGGPDRPALVVKDHWSDRTGHVLPSELIAAPAVSGTPDTKEDEL
jgi:hypothetical protein